ncbi:MAG: FMN-binding protein [Gemmatimonadota bacterium]|nr:FMN-binding protein [Gemmatimonadota bacterium]
MRRVVCGVLVAGVALCLGPPAAGAQGAADRVAASVQRVWGRGAVADTVPVDSTAVLRVSRDGHPAGWGVVRNVRGREQPITFLVAVDTGMRILDVDVLVYREPYGGEVAYESWRRQFRGRGPGDSLRVGREVRGISGATISVNAVTLGVRRALADLAAWRRAGRLNQ